MERREFLYWLGLAGAGAGIKPLWSADLQAGSPHHNFANGIDFDRRSLLIQGQRKFIFSGSVHYFRLPSPKQWEIRIKKLKELGYNAVDIYYYWGYHSPAEGEYDFKGSRDIDLFMDLVEAEGMYLVARPGPYICAEVDGGGFPGWLIARPELALRCRRQGKFVYDPEYMKHTREWYEQIIPKIVRHKNLILLQVENEFGFHFTPRGVVAKLQGAIQDAFGADFFMRFSTNPAVALAMAGNRTKAMQSPDYARHNRYLKELYDLARGLGCQVPIFHNEVGDPSVRYVDVDIPAIDNYPITNMAKDWKQGNPFAGIDVFEASLEALKMNCPLFGAEIQGGWYDLWGGYGFEKIRRRLGPLAMDLTLKSCLGQGTSILNIYMAAGGTNWGYLAAPDDYTSYDYGAPISEAGRISERGYPCRRFSEFVKSYEQDLLGSVSAAEFSGNRGETFCKARRAPTGKVFVFARNLSGKDQSLKNEFGEFQVSYPGMEIFVLEQSGKVIDHYGTYHQEESEPLIFLGKKPALEFRFQIFDEPFKAEAKEGWKAISGASDLDGLGFYYGFVWYRTKFQGGLSWIKLDARHLWAVYLNGELLKAYDNFQNRVGEGEDLAKTVGLEIPAGMIQDENLLVILVESLGHNKNFMEDAQNPRGLVSFQSDRKELDFEARAGLVPGESGITPRVDFAKIIFAGDQAPLPHKKSASAGLGIYVSEFELELPGPDQPGIGVKLSKCSGKANLYINGWLIGRYWDAVGPQKIFYLPPDLLKLKGKNELALVVWPWSKEIELGEVELVEYP